MKRHKYSDGRINAVVIAGEYYGKDLAVDLREIGSRRVGVRDYCNFTFSLGSFDNNPIGICFNYKGNSSKPKNLRGYALDITGRFDPRFLSNCLDQICDDLSIELISSERQVFEDVFLSFDSINRIK